MPPTDTPVTAAPAPAPAPQHSNKHFILGAVAIVALLLIVAGVYWYATKEEPIFPENAVVTASLGYVPASPLMTLNQARKTYTPVTQENEASAGLVIDRVVTNSGEYLLLLDPVNSRSNIVQRSGSADGEPFVAVTDTATMKFDLSYDETSDTFVYLAKAIATPQEFLDTRDWDVTTFRAGTETVIGTGLHAEVVPGKGAVVVGAFNGTLSWINLSGGTTTLAEREQAWVFAVRPDGNELALYNSPGNAIDRFDLSQGPSATRVTASVAAGSRPSALAYMGNDIVVARPNGTQTETTFAIAGDKRTLVVPNLNPAAPSAVYNLMIAL